ncbi:MAG: phage tail-like protein [Bacteroidia bacterium]|jgi:phage tail-like protein
MINPSQNFGTHPPLGHSFDVQVGFFPGNDCNFSEVTGISKSITFDTVYSGGDNSTQYHLPKTTTYEPLVLKRGIIPSFSLLYEWSNFTINGGLLSMIVPMPVVVKLLDEEGDALVSWMFSNAYPTKLEISEFKATENAVVVESITLNYSSFDRIN